MDEQLLPCPFCGSRAVYGKDVLNPHQCWYITCVNADCGATVGNFSQQDMAIQIWNSI